MTQLLKQTLTADGSTADFKASGVTFLLGDDDGANFGGGTLAIEVSHDGVNFTTDSTYTEEGVYSTNNYVGGLVYKLVLSGSTSPDLNVSIVYA